MQKIFGTGVYFSGSEFHLKATPVSIRQFDYGFDFPSFIVLIVIQPAVKGIGIDLQIPFRQRLKEKAQRVQILDQIVCRAVQKSSRKRGITEVMLCLLLDADRRTQRRRIRRLIIQQIQALKDIQIGRQGLRFDPFPLLIINVNSKSVGMRNSVPLRQKKKKACSAQAGKPIAQACPKTSRINRISA